MKPKKVSEKYIADFWKRHSNGKINSRQLVLNRVRRYYAISPTILGTVRRFPNALDLREYIGHATSSVKKINALKPKNFELMPAQVLDIDYKKNYALERVYQRPSVEQVLGEKRIKIFVDLKKEENFEKQSMPFLNSFKARMQEKGIKFEEVKKSVKKAFIEFERKAEKLGLNIDSHNSNILVIDYNPGTKKVVFAVIDWLGH